MSKTKLRLTILCILLLPLVTYSMVSLLNGRTLSKQRQELESKLAAAVEKKRGTNEMVSVRLEDLTSFEWDKVYIFTPYTPIEEINRALGVAWPQAEKMGIDKDDKFNLLVFTSQGKVVNYLQYPRNLGDFSSQEIKDQKQKGFSPRAAVFTIEAGNLGQLRFVLRQQNEP